MDEGAQQILSSGHAMSFSSDAPMKDDDVGDPVVG
jgi:hypothetical protein